MERPEKIYRTEVTVVVLSEDPLPPGSHLENIVHDMDVGNNIGTHKQGPSVEVTGDEAIVASLVEVGNDGNFFGDEDAEESDHGGAALGEDDEDADPAEMDDHGGAGHNEDAEDEPDGEDDGTSEEGHLDDPKYPLRAGVVVGGVSVCTHCLGGERVEDQTEHMPGETFDCDRCDSTFQVPVEVSRS